MNAIFMEPVFKQMIWGGTRLHTEFGYDIPGENTGECWAISAHPNGDCHIRDGEFAGMKLSELWRDHGELFGLTEKSDMESVFPLLTKIIDAKEDLSIQVHPDDGYAREHEGGELGKTECWYVLDADAGTTIVIGHNACSKEELTEMVREGKWTELLREIPVKKGDFFQIPPGTIHAIKGNTMILETQQNSDVTYRLYDYDRLSNGKPRELHTHQSLDVIRVPFDPDLTGRTPSDKHVPTENTWFEELVNCDLYTVWHASVSGGEVIHQDRDFLLVSVIDGEGKLGDVPVKKGDHFILPYGFEKTPIQGNMELIISASS